MSATQAGVTAVLAAHTEMPSVEQFLVHRMFSEFNPDGIRFIFNLDFVESFLSTPELEMCLPYVTVTSYGLQLPTLEEEILRWMGHGPNFFLAHIYELVRRQKNGEPGFLSLNSSTVFYVRPDRSVAVSWVPKHEAWWVGSFPVADNDGWLRGDRVAVRDRVH